MKSISSGDGWTDYRDNCNVTSFGLFSTLILFSLSFLFSLCLFFPPGIPSAPLLPPWVGFLYVEQIGNEALQSFGSLIERMCALEEYNPCDIFAA